MSDSFLDNLPSHEREKIRKRMRSPEAYERLREKVKGPEDLEKELQRSEQLAEVHFALESDRKTQESVKNQVQEDMREQGAEHILEELPPALHTHIEQGKFIVAVRSHPATHEDALVILPEGKVQEALPIKPSFSEQYVATVLKGKPSR